MAGEQMSSDQKVRITGKASASLLAVLALMLVLELMLAPATLAQGTNMDKSHSNYNGNNNLDSIISELIDDASQRLKKSKVGRHLKSSLRFGRRSDPLFVPTEFEAREDNNGLYQVPIALD